MVSEEDFQGVLAAQRAITQLETTGSISVNSTEHQALLWAVLRLGDEIMFDKRPLTEKELEYAKEIIIRYRGDAV